MRFPLVHDSHDPLYRQIERYLRDSILSGELEPDTRLPAGRRLAQELGVSRITVENAYAELQADGLVITRPGSGYYVNQILPSMFVTASGDATTVNEPLWQRELPECALFGGHEFENGNGIISFEAGSGDVSNFPVTEFRKIMQDVIRRDGTAAFEYGEYNGYAPLRSAIAHILTSRGIKARPENVLITSGSQQAIALCTQLLLKPGDTVLTENPTYSGALYLFRAYGLRVVGVPVDSEGMQTEKLESVLQQYHPKLIYTMPDFQNPTGTCLSNPRRQQLMALAERYNMAVIEDDYVGDLRYEGRAQSSLKALDPGGRVIYTGTFSKMLLPGLRIGFLLAEGPIYRVLTERKYVHDIAASNLMQRVLEVYLSIGRYRNYLRRSCRIYRERRDAMIKAIGEYLPASVSFDKPKGGLFIWLALPQGLAAEKLSRIALTEGVCCAQGKTFFTDQGAPRGAFDIRSDTGCSSSGSSAGGDMAESMPPPPDYLRLNFAMHTPEEIEEGVIRLGRAFART